MFNFLKNLFKPKNTEGPHPLDGPVRAAQEKAALPVPQAPPAPPPVVEPVPTPVVEQVPPPPAPAPAEPIANNTHILFPKTPEPAPAPVVQQAKKPRKPRAPKAVVMSAQPKKKK